MIKLFIDARPHRHLLHCSDFTEESMKKLITLTDVETNIAFDDNDSISLAVLSAADLLLQYLNGHDLGARVGIIYDYSPNYPGWLLVVETSHIDGSMNPLVAKFFSWDRTENQQLLSFNEIMGDLLDN